MYTLKKKRSGIILYATKEVWKYKIWSVLLRSLSVRVYYETAHSKEGWKENMKMVLDCPVVALVTWKIAKKLACQILFYENNLFFSTSSNVGKVLRGWGYIGMGSLERVDDIGGLVRGSSNWPKFHPIWKWQGVNKKETGTYPLFSCLL